MKGVHGLVPTREWRVVEVKHVKMPAVKDALDMMNVRPAKQI